MFIARSTAPFTFRSRLNMKLSIHNFHNSFLFFCVYRQFLVRTLIHSTPLHARTNLALVWSTHQFIQSSLSQSFSSQVRSNSLSTPIHPLPHSLHPRGTPPPLLFLPNPTLLQHPQHPLHPTPLILPHPPHLSTIQLFPSSSLPLFVDASTIMRPILRIFVKPWISPPNSASPFCSSRFGCGNKSHTRHCYVAVLFCSACSWLGPYLAWRASRLSFRRVIPSSWRWSSASSASWSRCWRSTCPRR